jgi:Protein of unknown function (DUF3298)
MRLTHTPRLKTLFVFALTTFVVLAILLLPLPACAAGLPQNGAPRALDGGKLPPEQSEARAGGEQRVFRGYVGEYRVRMRLRRAPGGKLSGSYSYEGRGGELTLKGSADAEGNFTLEEFDGAKKTGAFKGEWSEKDYEPEANISGNWTKPGGARGDAEYFYLTEEPQPSGGAAVATKQVREQNKKRGYTVDAEYPQIEGAGNFNALAEEFVTKEVAEFKRDAGRRPGEKDSMPDASEDSLDIRYFVRLLTTDLISVEFQIDYYEHGAAHGSHAFYEINYDAMAGRELQLADLFRPGSDYLKKISEVAIKQVRRWNKDSAAGGGHQYLTDEGITSGAGPDAENYHSWTITPRGLAVTFDYYQLGAYAAGAPKVVLPYADLKDVIRADGPLAPLLK